MEECAMDAPALSRPAPPVRQGIAERLWEASRVEFSQRGFHGARVQGVARRAGCNVALLYRHWSSKKALYIDLLRSSWKSVLERTLPAIEQGATPSAVVSAYLDAHLSDPVGAQIIIRELLDGGPFLSQLIAGEPTLTESVQRAARVLSASRDGTTSTLRPGVDATVAVLSIGGLAALVAAAHEAARPFLSAPISVEEWRRSVYELLLHGAVDGSR
jgi:AcrR family transcriptional regulator